MAHLHSFKGLLQSSPRTIIELFLCIPFIVYVSFILSVFNALP